MAFVCNGAHRGRQTTDKKGVHKIDKKDGYNIMAKVNSILANKMAKLAALQVASAEVESAFNTALESLHDFVATATAKAAESDKTTAAIWNEYKYRAELAIKYALGENRKGQKSGAQSAKDGE